MLEVHDAVVAAVDEQDGYVHAAQAGVVELADGLLAGAVDEVVRVLGVGPDHVGARLDELVGGEGGVEGRQSAHGLR